MTRRHSLSVKLGNARALLGLLQAHASPWLTELVAMCGYDFVFLDGEHGIFSEGEIVQALQTLTATDTLGMIRLRTHDTQSLGRYLDMGADAIVVPNVSTVEQARMLAAAMNFPPRGTRGMGASLHRVTRYGLDKGNATGLEQERTALLVIIESASGVVNAEGILAIEGVDGVIIGPSDLSADMGFPGDFSQHEFKQAVSQIEKAALSSEKILGTAPYDGSPIEALLERGHQLLILDADVSLVRDALLPRLEQAKSHL
jgi:4-hydroxy-2-oxoheptanedioate aldolase